MVENKIKILIKKEILELVFNFKSWINVVLWAAIPYLPQIYEPYHKYIIAVLFSVFAGGQYVYDSYLSDIQFKGAFFLHNIKVVFFQIFFVKLVISSLLSFVAMLINIPNIIMYITATDIYWILPLFISFSAIMYLASIFSKGAEITSAIISVLFGTVIFACTFIIKSFLLKSIFSVLVACFLIFVSFKISFSKPYRTQL